MRLFAGVRHQLGVAALELEMPAAVNAGQLRQLIASQYPHAASLIQLSRVALGDEYVADDHALTDGCEAALIPPVSGG